MQGDVLFCAHSRIIYSMASGPQTTIALLAQKLQRRWVPKWYEAFTHDADGGFHERLGHSFKPVKTGQRRLLTQCRQLAVYAHAVAEGNAHFKPNLAQHLDFIVTYYKGGCDGSWVFAVDDDLVTQHEMYDLYAHAFVIFALAHYERAVKDGQGKTLAMQVLAFINQAFRVDGQEGLTEALNDRYDPINLPRRHESHMHLFEACLFAYEVFEEDGFLEMSEYMVDLFRNYFYKKDQSFLSEYFDQELNPVEQNGNIVKEPGHYCEWIWLLKKFAALKGESDCYDDICLTLLDWANAYGWDTRYGGIYDELGADNQIITDTKRLWPFSEALKANALMLDSGVDKDGIKDYIAHMVSVFNEHYMDERGFWTEWLSRDLQPQTDYMPGTTPYHVYFGITEAQEALQLRGETKSMRLGVLSGVYDVRRSLSETVRRFRKLLTKNTNGF